MLSYMYIANWDNDLRLDIQADPILCVKTSHEAVKSKSINGCFEVKVKLRLSLVTTYDLT